METNNAENMGDFSDKVPFMRQNCRILVLCSFVICDCIPHSGNQLHQYNDTTHKSIYELNSFLENFYFLL